MEVKNTLPEGTTQPEKITPNRKRSRKRSIITFALVSLLNVGLLILLWSQLLTPAHNSPSTDGTVPGPLLGHPAPDFKLAALSPHQVSTIDLANFKGKPVVLNFWSSSCAPCQDEAPMLQAAWQHAQAQGIVFIGIDFQDPQSDGLGFLQRYKVTYLNVLDSNGATAIHYGITYTPTTLFINRQGVVVRSIAQELTAQQLQSGLELL